MSQPILATKLYIPLPRSNTISRPRLIERLNEGLYRPLTLISAPAGFGKTTLLSGLPPLVQGYVIRAITRGGCRGCGLVSDITARYHRSLWRTGAAPHAYSLALKGVAELILGSTDSSIRDKTLCLNDH